MGIAVKVSELKSVQLKGGGVVDDKAPISSLDDLRRWYMGSSLYCKFHDAELAPAKCAVHSKEYVQAPTKMQALRLHD